MSCSPCHLRLHPSLTICLFSALDKEEARVIGCDINEFLDYLSHVLRYYKDTVTSYNTIIRYSNKTVSSRNLCAGRDILVVKSAVSFC